MASQQSWTFVRYLLNNLVHNTVYSYVDFEQKEVSDYRHKRM